MGLVKGGKREEVAGISCSSVVGDDAVDVGLGG